MNEGFAAAKKILKQTRMCFADCSGGQSIDIMVEHVITPILEFDRMSAFMNDGEQIASPIIFMVMRGDAAVVS